MTVIFKSGVPKVQTYARRFETMEDGRHREGGYNSQADEYSKSFLKECHRHLI